MHTLLIINPSSGQGKGTQQKRKLLDAVSSPEHVHNYHVGITTGSNDAYRMAKDAVFLGSYDRIVAAGGDGTINQVINGIGDSKIPLGIIPLGTGNVLAHDLGIPSNNVERAMEIINAGRIKEVDLGMVDGHRFILMAGMGLDAHVVDSVSTTIKDLFGTMAYMPAALEQVIKYTPTRVRLIFENGSEYATEAYAVVVANCGSYAYNFKISKEAVFDDGLLDVLVFESAPLSKLKLVSQALEAVFQQQISDPNTTYFKTTKVRVESDPPVKMQIDGDVHGESGVDIEILPKALKLIVP